MRSCIAHQHQPSYVHCQPNVRRIWHEPYICVVWWSWHRKNQHGDDDLFGNRHIHGISTSFDNSPPVTTVSNITIQAAVSAMSKHKGVLFIFNDFAMEPKVMQQMCARYLTHKHGTQTPHVEN
jgi:hypothetical protein